MSSFSIIWITAPISVILIGLIYLETRKPKKLEITVGHIEWSVSSPPAMPPQTATPGHAPSAPDMEHPAKSIPTVQVILVIMATICAMFPFLRWHTPQEYVQASVLSAGPTVNQGVVVTNQSQVPQMSVGGAVGQIPDTVGFNFEFVLRMVNTGPSASVVWNWKAFAVVPNRKGKVAAQIPYIISVESSGPIMTPFGPIRCALDNNLVQTLVTNEIPSGKAVIGWVALHVNGESNLLSGTRFILSFEDAFHNETTIEHTWYPADIQTTNEIQKANH